VLHQILHARYALPQSIGTEWYDRGDEYEWGRILIGMAISRQVDGGYELHRHACGGAGARHTCMHFELMVFSEDALKSMCPHTFHLFNSEEERFGSSPLSMLV
jgi:hypothetical protein